MPDDSYNMSSRATSSSASHSTGHKRHKRNFQINWITTIGVVPHDSHNVKCMICGHILSQRTHVLKNHFTTHSDLSDAYDGDEWKQKLLRMYNEYIDSHPEEIRLQPQGMMQGCGDTIVDRVVNEITYLLAKRGRPFTDGPLIQECLIRAFRLIEPKKVETVKALHMSKQTIWRRVLMMGYDLESQLKEQFKRFKYWSIALDETTDITHVAQLNIFVRGVTPEFNVVEEFVALIPLMDGTKAVNLWDALLKVLTAYGADYNKLVAIVTDGAPSMVGSSNGLVAKLRKYCLDNEYSSGRPLLAYHCLIHQQQLAAKAMNLTHVMDVVSSIAKKIRMRPAVHHRFRTFLEESDAPFDDIPFYTEIRWCSRSKLLNRFISMLGQIREFLFHESITIPQLYDSYWLCDLAFLSDICGKLNDLNQALQGRKPLISQLYKKVTAFEIRLTNFIDEFSHNNLENFDNCKKMFQDYKWPAAAYIPHLAHLKQELSSRFGEFRAHDYEFCLIDDPFDVRLEQQTRVSTDVAMRDEVERLRGDDDLRMSLYSTRDRAQFYKDLQGYPLVKDLSSRILAMFGSTYICEQTFSRMNFLKSKCRTQLLHLSLEAQLRICTSTFCPTGIFEVLKYEDKILSEE